MQVFQAPAPVVEFISPAPPEVAGPSNPQIAERIVEVFQRVPHEGTQDPVVDETVALVPQIREGLMEVTQHVPQ